MEIIIKSVNIDLTQNLRDYIEDKIGSCEKFINTEFPVNSYVEVERTTFHHQKGDIFRAEVNLILQSKKILRVVVKKEDIYSAINEAKNLLQRKLKQYREKQSAKERKGARKALGK